MMLTQHAAVHEEKCYSVVSCYSETICYSAVPQKHSGLYFPAYVTCNSFDPQPSFNQHLDSPVPVTSIRLVYLLWLILGCTYSPHYCPIFALMNFAFHLSRSIARNNTTSFSSVFPIASHIRYSNSVRISLSNPVSPRLAIAQKCSWCS